MPRFYSGRWTPLNCEFILKLAIFYNQFTKFQIKKEKAKANLIEIQKLNSNTTEEYIYHGQSIHRLAHEYYERNHNKNYKSQLSPQVANVFNNKLSKNTAFNIT